MTENSYKTPCGCIHYFVNIIDKQKKYFSIFTWAYSRSQAFREADRIF